ncbi:MAG TPA: transglutaminase-like domain-containing protein [Clostridia bacterium]|nr:transglutaminase-like domain-containing protein [Clostridia bacterium]
MSNINENFRYLNVGLPEDIARLKAWGDIDEAVRLIDLRLKADIPQPLRGCFIAQREMMQRLADDFKLSFDQAMAEATDRVAGFTCEEFDTLVDLGRIDWIYLNGEKRYFKRFVNTLIKTHPDIRERSIQRKIEKGEMEEPPAPTGEHILDRSMRLMHERGALSNCIRIRASVKIEDTAFERGRRARVWLPIPAACPQQSEIKLLSFSEEPKYISPEDAPQRTVCFERTLDENREFFVEYSYVHTARYCDPMSIKADREQPKFFLNEEDPHIVFTPYLRAIAAELVKGTDDPAEKARRIFGFVTGSVKYSFMPNYFVLENIPENAARNFKGDCGVQALLFITLCRLVGIPARWQSGLCCEPYDVGAHDWAMFYIAPYGWLFADPSYGGSAHRAGNEARRWHYFGNLDPYRMVANCEFQHQFEPPMTHWRADPYDNQVGEIEYEDRSLRWREYERTQIMTDYQEL